MSYMYRSTSEILRFHSIPLFIFPLQWINITRCMQWKCLKSKHDLYTPEKQWICKNSYFIIVLKSVSISVLFFFVLYTSSFSKYQFNLSSPIYKPLTQTKKTSIHTYPNPQRLLSVNNPPAHFFGFLRPPFSIP